MDGRGIERGEFWDSGDNVTISRMCDASLQLMGHRMNLQAFALVFNEKYYSAVTMFEC